MHAIRRALRNFGGGLTFGFAPVLCNPPPGPCLGLQLGDELAFAIKDTYNNQELPCDFEGLGFVVNGKIHLTVDEQLPNGNGERAYCAVSTGRVWGDTGWEYERAPKDPPMEGSFGVVLGAASPNCTGELSLEVYADQESASASGWEEARLYVDFRQTRTAGQGCPRTCVGRLEGPLSLER